MAHIKLGELCGLTKSGTIAGLFLDILEKLKPPKTKQFRMNTTQAKFQKNSKTANWTWTFIYLEKTQAKIPDKLKNFQLDLAKKVSKKALPFVTIKDTNGFRSLFF